jgi:excisionase family DNA binding protein
MKKQYMSIKEASEFSGLSKWTLYQYSARAKLKVLKVGTRTLVPIKDFQEWLESHERVNTDKEGSDEG